MVDLALNILITFMAFVGFVFNVYIVVSVAMTKQVKPCYGLL
jgi:phage shock protein PspC (stress-responsive transcriptional regulator)